MKSTTCDGKQIGGKEPSGWVRQKADLEQDNRLDWPQTQRRNHQA